jgi:hypothetical protein
MERAKCDAALMATSASTAPGRMRARSPFVFDLLMILSTIIFFILALAYIQACERLR